METKFKKLRVYSYLLTCLPFFPAVVSNISYVVVFNVLLDLMHSRGFELRLEVAGDVVVDAQVLRLPFHSLTRGPEAESNILYL